MPPVHVYCLFFSLEALKYPITGLKVSKYSKIPGLEASKYPRIPGLKASKYTKIPDLKAIVHWQFLVPIGAPDNTYVLMYVCTMLC